MNEHNAGDPVPAMPGAEFVVVQTEVANNTDHSIDLTCSLPVIANLVDDRERAFDPVDDLAGVLPNNPGCNDNVNPGFAVPMAWAFEVPVGTPAVAFAFTDFDLGFGNAGAEPTVIVLPAT